MERQYFDTVLFNKILNMCDIDINIGLEMFKEYINNYPHDYNGYSGYAANLIKVRKIEEAEQILNHVEELFRKKKYYDPKKEKLFTSNLIFNKLKLLCYQQKYQEAIDLVNQNKELLLSNKINLGAVILYCYKKLELPYPESDLEDYYLFNQIKSYDEELFRKHIEKHLIKYKLEEDENTTSIFYENFPIDEILEKVMSTIPNENKVNAGFFDNHYYFKYDSCGKCFKEKDRQNLGSKYEKRILECAKLIDTDYFKIITFDNSNNIITMCPCESNKGFDFVDLNYLKKPEAAKVKRKSKIDIFNEKYNNSIDK